MHIDSSKFAVGDCRHSQVFIYSFLFCLDKICLLEFQVPEAIGKMFLGEGRLGQGTFKPTGHTEGYGT